jgi:hypothetical protein
MDNDTFFLLSNKLVNKTAKFVIMPGDWKEKDIDVEDVILDQAKAINTHTPLNGNDDPRERMKSMEERMEERIKKMEERMEERMKRMERMMEHMTKT